MSGHGNGHAHGSSPDNMGTASNHQHQHHHTHHHNQQAQPTAVQQHNAQAAAAAYGRMSWGMPQNYLAAGLNPVLAAGMPGAALNTQTSLAATVAAINTGRLSPGNNVLTGPGGRRFGSRTGNPYETSLARRRANNGRAVPAARGQQQQPPQRSGGSSGGNVSPADSEEGQRNRRRVGVACTRCRRRKIRCSGDDGTGGPCISCKNANEPHCQFLRVQASTMSQLARKQQAMAAANFPYDLQACRQYQSRGAAAVPAIRSNSSSMAGPSPGYAVPTSSVMNNGAGMYQHQHAGSFPYEWAPGVSTAATGFSAEGGSTTAGAMGYSMCPQAYHGMPSPDEPYLGENDMMERPATSNMADAGAFALQSMAQGLPTDTSGHGGGNSSGSSQLSRSLPGAPNVLGSSRVPPSTVFSSASAVSSRPPSYPSPATTPIANGVSPVWGGYDHQSPYTTMAAPVPSTMAAQSLERLPDLYSATPPPQQQQMSAPPPSTTQGGCSADEGQTQHAYAYGVYGEASLTSQDEVKREHGDGEADVDEAGANMFGAAVSGGY